MRINIHVKKNKFNFMTLLFLLRRIQNTENFIFINDNILFPNGNMIIIIFIPHYTEQLKLYSPLKHNTIIILFLKNETSSIKK